MRSLGRVLSTVGAVVCLTAPLASAQSTSTSTQQTKQFEVIAVNGNDLVVKLPEGTRELTVPANFKLTVDGKPMSVSELKPGMVGTATITTRTTMTPVTVTEVKNGTVAQVGGNRIVVRTDEGLRAFTQGDIDKRAITIIRDGKAASISDFYVGDRLSAKIVTTKPPTVVTEKEVQATINRAAPAAPQVPAAHPQPVPAAHPEQAAAARPEPVPAAHPQDAVTEPVVAEPPKPVATSGSASAEPAAQQLPKTSGSLPLIGSLGVAALAIGAALAMRRRRLAR